MRSVFPDNLSVSYDYDKIVLQDISTELFFYEVSWVAVIYSYV